MVKKNDFTFCDLFAGIGGIRMALEKAGGDCVFSSEWNKYSRETYHENFNEWPEGDITKIKPKDIPDHDVLAAGFPCQPFSLAGISKKNSMNRPVGFDDEEQGNLFFNVVNIIKQKRPSAVLLENVKNLKTHDNGNTFSVIKKSLEKLEYEVHAEVLDGKYLVPQHRERIFIVAFNKNTKYTEFKFPKFRKIRKTLDDILDENPGEKYTLTQGVWNALKRHAAHHKKKGNGFGYGIAKRDGISRTLSARYYKDGAEILISQGPGKRPRRLTPRECCKLMGFPSKYKIKVSDNQAYRQFGNSVVVPIVESVARNMVNSMYVKRKVMVKNSVRKRIR
jgi:DNA (cytosine-5)-methyltransferase 1